MNHTLLIITAALTFSLSTAMAQTSGQWTQQSPLPTGSNLNSLDMISLSEGWAVGYGGAIIHTTDGGATWTVQNTGTDQPLYVVRFLDSLHGWAGSNGTVLYTTDGGASWKQGAGIAGGIKGLGFTDASNGFAAQGVSIIFRTRDGGATWTQQQVPAAVSSFRFFDSLNGVAVGSGGVLHTSDGGSTWNLQPGSTHGGFFINPSEGWYISGNTALHTTDGGSTWQPQTLPANAWIVGSYFLDSLNGWAVGWQQNIIHTTDGGNTWVTQSGGTDAPLNDAYPFSDVHFADPTHGIAVGTYGLIYTTSNGGSSWSNRESGSPTITLDMTATDASHLWTSQTGAEILRTSDGGQHWIRSNAWTADQNIPGISFANNLSGWAVTYATGSLSGMILHTGDAGDTWQKQFSTRQLFGVAALDANTAIAVGGTADEGAAVFRTTNGGASWTDLSSTVPVRVLYAIRFVDSTTGWAVGDGGFVFKSSSAGATWVQQYSGVDRPLSGVSFVDVNNGWAVGDGGTVIHTTDGGTTWTTQNPGTTNNLSGVFAVSPTVAWISGYDFIARTTDGGQIWVPETVAPAPTSYTGLYFLDPDNGWAGGFSGIFRRTGSPTPAVNLNPTSLSFDKQLLGTTSAVRTVTLTNSGSGPLNIAGIVASGDFAQSNNCPSSPNTLAPGAFCTLSVTFTPTGINTRTGALTITDDAPSNPQIVPLNGIGTVVTVSPSSLNFGKVNLNKKSQPQGTTLTNHGTTPLTLSAVSISGINEAEFAITANTCIGNIPPNGTCVVTMIFKPTAIGVRSATLAINHNGGGSPSTVSLTGTGR